jgi:hypothetical protein
MVYVLDTSVLSALHRNYYRERFPSLWKLFDQMIVDGGFTSTREVFREIEDLGGAVLEWATKNQELFVVPNAKEGGVVATIYAVTHFQANMEKQKIYKGGKNADPFVVARAAVLGGTVVSMEKLRPNAAKIPNICQHFGVGCIDLEEFMEVQGWTF